VIPNPGADELSGLAQELGLGISAEELDDYRAVLQDLLDTFRTAQGAQDLQQAQSSQAGGPPLAERGPGRRPEPAEDPLNAIARWCEVKGSDRDGPLAGVRVGIKDCIAVGGVEMTFGSPLLEGYTPSRDSVIAERILAAGGEIVAITNMDDLAAGPIGETCRYGRIRNPVDPARVTGGSSGGSAAALYYDSIDVTVGTDTGGSIRTPSSLCGVIGLKPTFGLVPMTGVGALDESIDHAGPLARTTAELAALLSAIAGPHPDDPLHRYVETADYPNAVANAAGDLKGVRIGVLCEGFGDEVGTVAETADAVGGVVERMAESGAEVVAVSVPEHLIAGALLYAIYAEGSSDYWRSGGVNYGSPRRYDPEFAQAFSDGILQRLALVSPDVKVTLLAGEWVRRTQPGVAYANAQSARPAIRAAYDEALRDVDLIVLPTTPFVAYEATEVGPAERMRRSWAAEGNVGAFDLTGHPAISLPLAEVDGLPQGLMAVGRHFEEARLLSFAATCERALGLRPPYNV
jgi:amidase